MAGLSVIGMKDDDVPSRLPQDRFSSRAEPARLSCQQRGAASVQPGLAVRIHVWASYIMRAAHPRAVIALHSTAAQIEGHEQIIIIAVMDNERSFDRLPIRGQSGRRGARIFGPLAPGP